MGPPNDVKPSLRKATNTSWTPLLNASPAKSGLHGLAGKSASAYLCHCKPVSAELGGPIESSRGAALPLDRGDKVALALDDVQHWIKAAGAERVAMKAEFVDHPLPADLPSLPHDAGCSPSVNRRISSIKFTFSFPLSFHAIGNRYRSQAFQ